MTHPVSLFGAAALGVALASSWPPTRRRFITAPNIRPPSRPSDHRSPARRAVADPRHLGSRRLAPGLCSRHAAAAAARSTVQADTFVGVRGTRPAAERYSLPEANRPLITSPGPATAGRCWACINEAAPHANEECCGRGTLMTRRFQTLDVFTETALAGNPLAVVLDAEGLDDARMQAIAAEFNLSETVFVFEPRNAINSARVRIFTPEARIAVRRPSHGRGGGADRAPARRRSARRSGSQDRARGADRRRRLRRAPAQGPGARRLFRTAEAARTA